ncbi:MAG: hypothetical protein JXB62_07280 [Pirellulales bacterium]|nr:hypothetical protein [Pirellulales bacterium]
MTRGNVLPVAWLLLAASIGRLAVPASGQEPMAGLYEHETISHGPQSEAGCCSQCGMPYEELGPGGHLECLHPNCWLPGFGEGPMPRHGDLGRPLQRESWLFRPFSAGWFMGMMQGSPLIDDWVGQQQGYVGGYRFGWDQSYYWGGEMRFAFASVELYDSPRAIAAGPSERFNVRRDVDLTHWDLDLLYYPWGDTQWRPYFMVGLGTARVIFIDRLSHRYDSAVFAMPLAMGVKYRCNDWLALRFELTDNMAFSGGGGFNTLHSLSLTGGVEVRFGGARKAYWPWNPGRHYW